MGLEASRGAQDKRVRMQAPDDLKPDRQSLRREAARHARRRLPGEIERIGEWQPVEHTWRRAPVDFVRTPVDGPGAHGHLGCQQEVARLEELACLLVEGGARQKCLAMLDARHTASVIKHL
jgi:hypothetical protein